MRSKRQPAENHERWLLSYADFITLLFAFFVVVFATSQVDKKRMANMAAAYSSYLGGEESTERSPGCRQRADGRPRGRRCPYSRQS